MRLVLIGNNMGFSKEVRTWLHAKIPNLREGSVKVLGVGNTAVVDASNMEDACEVARVLREGKPPCLNDLHHADIPSETDPQWFETFRGKGFEDGERMTRSIAGRKARVGVYARD